MPNAPLLSRIVALGLDGILLTVLLGFLLLRILIPLYHPDGWQEFHELLQNYWTELNTARDTNAEPPAEPDFFEYPAVVEMISFSQMVSLLVMTLYFGLSEGLMNGATLGKKFVRIQTVGLLTDSPPGLFTSLVRAAFKSLTLLAPALFWVFFGIAIFNSQRQTLHDLLSRTKVVREKL